jgi:uncharacterized protein YjiS (DUF1127 family)
MTTNTAAWDAERSQSIGFLSMIQRATEALARARAKRRTLSALGELDDHVLVDIGVNPGDVRRNHQAVTDWVVQSHSGTARLVFVGR